MAMPNVSPDEVYAKLMSYKNQAISKGLKTSFGEAGMGCENCII